MSDRGLQVGMIGLNVSGDGWAAEAHAPAVLAVDGLELAAVATRSRKSAEAAAARFGIPRVFGDPFELIADPGIDVVAVVSPVPSHRELLQAAMGARKHVLTEWPVAVGSEEIGGLAAMAATAGIRTAVDLQARRSPAAVRAASLVAEGGIGRVLSINALSTTAAFGARPTAAELPLERAETWMNLRTIQTAHTLDLAIAIAGPIHDLRSLLDIQYPSLAIEGRDDPVRRRLPDHVLLQARFDRGGTLAAEVIGGRPAGSTPFRMEVLGEDGSLTLLGGGPRGFQAGRLRLTVDRQDVRLDDDPLNALADPVVNVAHVYAALRDDIVAGTSTAPDLAQGAALARLVDDLV